MKSGWTAIDKSDASQNPHPNEDAYLTRKAFEVMREVPQDKVTTLGQDLDYQPNTNIEIGIEMFIEWYKTYYKVD